MPQGAVGLLPGGGGVLGDGGPVGGLLLLQQDHQAVGQVRQVVQQAAGGPVQDTQGVGVDQRRDAGCPRAWNGRQPGADRCS